MTIQDRFGKIKKDLFNDNQKAFAERIGVAPSVIANVIGPRHGNPSFDVISKICANANISADWLLTGNGPMMNSDAANDSVASDNKYKEEPFEPSLVANSKLVPPKKHIIKSDSSTYGIPLITIEAVAGFPTIDEPGRAIADCDRYVVPEFADKGAQFLIRVSGSSMYPKYSSGDILACKKITERLFFQWGKIYVIDSSQGILVKRIFPDNDHPDMIMLVSDNKENYPPFDIPKSDIRSLSIVIGAIRFE